MRPSAFHNLLFYGILKVKYELLHLEVIVKMRGQVGVDGGGLKEKDNWILVTDRGRRVDEVDV